jgi:hypothetical protein
VSPGKHEIPPSHRVLRHRQNVGPRAVEQRLTRALVAGQLHVHLFQLGLDDAHQVLAARLLLLLLMLPVALAPARIASSCRALRRHVSRTPSPPKIHAELNILEICQFSTTKFTATSAIDLQHPRLLE